MPAELQRAPSAGRAQECPARGRGPGRAQSVRDFSRSMGGSETGPPQPGEFQHAWGIIC